MPKIDIRPAINILKNNTTHDLQMSVQLNRIVECCLDDSGGTGYTVIIFQPKNESREGGVLWESNEENFVTFSDVITLMAHFEAQTAFPDPQAIEPIKQ